MGLLLIFGVLNLIDAQDRVEIGFLNCDGISANLVTQNPICSNCYSSPDPCTSYLLGTTTVLQKQVGSNWVNVNTKPGHNHTFLYLQSGVTYRVQIYYPVSIGCSYVTNCSGQIQYYCTSLYTSQISESFEAGTPTPNGGFWDVSGIPGNDLFCKHDPVVFNASPTTGETSYSVSLADAFGNWTTTGWISGEAGLIDLEEVWTQYHSGWWLWPGDYTMQLAVSSPCQGYVEDFFPFEVVEMDCRQGSYGEGMDLSGMLIYPNPVEDILNLNGLENVTKDKEYYITDMSSRTISQGKLEEDRISVSHLDAGMYIFTVITEDDRVSKKFVKK